MDLSASSPAVVWIINSRSIWKKMWYAVSGRIGFFGILSSGIDGVGSAAIAGCFCGVGLICGAASKPCKRGGRLIPVWEVDMMIQIVVIEEELYYLCVYRGGRDVRERHARSA